MQERNTLPGAPGRRSQRARVMVALDFEVSSGADRPGFRAVQSDKLDSQRFQLYVALRAVAPHRDAGMPRQAVDQAMKRTDMHILTREQWTLSSTFTHVPGCHRYLFAVALFILTLLSSGLLEIRDIHGDFANRGFQSSENILHVDRLLAHVADDAQPVQILLPAAVDDHPGRALPAKTEIQQMGVYQPDKHRRDADADLDYRLICFNPLNHGLNENSSINKCGVRGAVRV